MPNIRLAVVAAICLTGLVGPALSAGLPTKVGECSTTKISQIGSRLDGVPGSGSAVSYANGGHQVSYDMIPGIQHSRAGDAIKLCLIELPTNCPPGDDRGKIYRATNLRTHATWEAPDTQHSCGGA
jgi:hypothetical protein